MFNDRVTGHGMDIRAAAELAMYIDRLSAERCACEDAMEARDFSYKKRKKMAKHGKAMPGGGYPIATRGDVENAVRAIGRAKNRAKTIHWIMKRARALGAMDLVPDDWKHGKHIHKAA